MPKVILVSLSMCVHCAVCSGQAGCRWTQRCGGRVSAHTYFVLHHTCTTMWWWSSTQWLSVVWSCTIHTICQHYFCMYVSVHIFSVAMTLQDFPLLNILLLTIRKQRMWVEHVCSNCKWRMLASYSLCTSIRPVCNSESAVCRVAVYSWSGLSLEGEHEQAFGLHASLNFLWFMHAQFGRCMPTHTT